MLLGGSGLAFFLKVGSIKSLSIHWLTGAKRWVATKELVARWGHGTSKLSVKLPKLPTLDLPDGKEFRMKINVLTYDRFDSFSRLVASLQQAEYYGYRVDLNIFLDRKKGREPDQRILDLIEKSESSWVS